MRPARPLLPILLVLSLAGCTFGGGESTGPDKSGYDGGKGVALSITNDGGDPFDVDVRVLGVGNVEVASFSVELGPGDAVERWYDLEEGTYSARLAYVWDAESGRTARGDDERAFSTAECPVVSRLPWSLRQSAETVGSSFLGKECVDEDGAANATA